MERRERKSEGRRSSILKRQDTYGASERTEDITDVVRAPRRLSVSFASTTHVRIVSPIRWASHMSSDESSVNDQSTASVGSNAPACVFTRPEGDDEVQFRLPGGLTSEELTCTVGMGMEETACIELSVGNTSSDEPAYFPDRTIHFNPEESMAEMNLTTCLPQTEEPSLTDGMTRLSRRPSFSGEVSPEGWKGEDLSEHSSQGLIPKSEFSSLKDIMKKIIRHPPIANLEDQSLVVEPESEGTDMEMTGDVATMNTTTALQDLSVNKQLTPILELSSRMDSSQAKMGHSFSKNMELTQAVGVPIQEKENLNHHGQSLVVEPKSECTDMEMTGDVAVMNTTALQDLSVNKQLTPIQELSSKMDFSQAKMGPSLSKSMELTQALGVPIQDKENLNYHGQSLVVEPESESTDMEMTGDVAIMNTTAALQDLSVNKQLTPIQELSSRMDSSQAKLGPAFLKNMELTQALGVHIQLEDKKNHIHHHQKMNDIVYRQEKTSDHMEFTQPLVTATAIEQDESKIHAISHNAHGYGQDVCTGTLEFTKALGSILTGDKVDTEMNIHSHESKIHPRNLDEINKENTISHRMSDIHTGNLNESVKENSVHPHGANMRTGNLNEMDKENHVFPHGSNMSTENVELTEALGSIEANREETKENHNLHFNSNLSSNLYSETQSAKSNPSQPSGHLAESNTHPGQAHTETVQGSQCMELTGIQSQVVQLCEHTPEGSALELITMQPKTIHVSEPLQGGDSIGRPASPGLAAVPMQEAVISESVQGDPMPEMRLLAHGTEQSPQTPAPAEVVPPVPSLELSSQEVKGQEKVSETDRVLDLSKSFNEQKSLASLPSVSFNENTHQGDNHMPLDLSQLSGKRTSPPSTSAEGLSSSKHRKTENIPLPGISTPSSSGVLAITTRTSRSASKNFDPYLAMSRRRSCNFDLVLGRPSEVKRKVSLGRQTPGALNKTSPPSLGQGQEVNETVHQPDDGSIEPLGKETVRSSDKKTLVPSGNKSDRRSVSESSEEPAQEAPEEGDTLGLDGTLDTTAMPDFLQLNSDMDEEFLERELNSIMQEPAASVSMTTPQASAKEVFLQLCAALDSELDIDLSEMDNPLSELPAPGSCQTEAEVLCAGVFHLPRVEATRKDIKYLEGEIERLQVSMENKLRLASQEDSALLHSSSLAHTHPKIKTMVEDSKRKALAKYRELETNYWMDCMPGIQSAMETLISERETLTSSKERLTSMFSQVEEYIEKQKNTDEDEELKKKKAELGKLEKGNEALQQRCRALDEETELVLSKIKALNKQASDQRDEMAQLNTTLTWLDSLTEWTVRKTAGHQVQFGFLYNSVVLEVTLQEPWNHQCSSSSSDHHHSIVSIAARSRLSDKSKPWACLANRLALENLEPEALNSFLGGRLGQTLQQISSTMIKCRLLGNDLKAIHLGHGLSIEGTDISIQVLSKPRRCKLALSTRLTPEPSEPLSWQVEVLTQLNGSVKPDEVQQVLCKAPQGWANLGKSMKALVSWLDSTPPMDSH